MSMKVELKCGKQTDTLKIKKDEIEKCKILMYILHGESLKKKYFPNITSKNEMTCKIDGNKESIEQALMMFKKTVEDSCINNKPDKDKSSSKKKDKKKKKKKSDKIKLDDGKKKKNKDKKKKKDKSLSLNFNDNKKSGLVHIGHRII